MPNVRDYPAGEAARSQWIVEQRQGVKRSLPADWDPGQPVGYLSEEEPDQSGGRVTSATIFLANSECPWRCLMCDLWRHTLARPVPTGAILRQMDYALERLPPTREVKLYNAGSFFDPRAIPTRDHAGIAHRLRDYERVIVECHPALVREPVARFQRLLAGRLEVAMGLETIHPRVGPLLNKQMTPELFQNAAGFLLRHDIDLRVFILLQPPFLPAREAVEWALRSVAFAWECAARAAILIPTREGNGAMEALSWQGLFIRPRLSALEAALEQALEKRQGVVMADLWDLERFSNCPSCFVQRRKRLEVMNLTQRHLRAALCPVCHGQS